MPSYSRRAGSTPEADGSQEAIAEDGADAGNAERVRRMEAVQEMLDSEVDDATFQQIVDRALADNAARTRVGTVRNAWSQLRARRNREPVDANLAAA